MKKLSYLAIFYFFSARAAQVLIITHSYNQPEFIEWQHKTFNKFLHDDFEFVVFNDAVDDTIAQLIIDVCMKLSVRCFRVPQENRGLNAYSVPSRRHAEAAQYSMEMLGFNHDGIVMMVDSDMFLINDFCVVDYLKEHDIAGICQSSSSQKYHYLWAGLIFFKMNSLPEKNTINLSDGFINGERIDTGGNLYYYFQAHPELKIRYLEKYRFMLDNDLRVYIEMPGWTKVYAQCITCKKNGDSCSHNTEILMERGFNKKLVDRIASKRFPPDSEFVLNDIFFHYRCASYFDGSEQKKRLFNEFMNEIVQS